MLLSQSHADYSVYILIYLFLKAANVILLLMWFFIPQTVFLCKQQKLNGHLKDFIPAVACIYWGCANSARWSVAGSFPISLPSGLSAVAVIYIIQMQPHSSPLFTCLPPDSELPEATIHLVSQMPGIICWTEDKFPVKYVIQLISESTVLLPELIRCLIATMIS